MQKVNQRLLSTLLSGLLVSSNITPVMASTMVKLNITIDDTPTIIEAQVPAVLELNMDKDGNITVPDDIELINMSSEHDIILSNLRVDGLNNWEIKDFNSYNQIKSMEPNTKQLAMSFNNDKTTDGGQVSLTANNWVIDKSDSIDVNIEAVAPKQTIPSEDNIAKIEYTFEVYREQILCNKCNTEVENPQDHLLACGHYSCIDHQSHNPASCGENNHFECDELDHSICNYCGEASCSGEHGLGKCDNTDLRINYTNGLMLSGSENIATVIHNYADEDYIESIESSDENIATVQLLNSLSSEKEQNILVTGVSRGKATVTVTMKSGASESFNVEVCELDDDITNNISSNTEYKDNLDTSSLVKDCLAGTDVSIPVIDSNGANSTIDVEITEDMIEYIEDKELVPGDNTVEIRVNINNITVNITLNILIKAPLEGIEIIGTENTIKETESMQLDIKYMPSYTTDNKEITWESSNDSIATVTNTGEVTGISSGSVTITATTADGKFSDTYNITVNELFTVESVSLNKSSIVLYEDLTEQLIVSHVPSDIGDTPITWKSSNTSVAKVSNNGLVEPVGIGTATITVSVGDKTATCEVEVVALTDLELTADSLSWLGYEKDVTEHLVIPYVFEYNNTWYKPVSTAEYLFKNHTKLKSVEMPDSIETLGNSTFSLCSGLESVKLSKNITKLPDGCFMGCAKLKDIDISNITSLGSYCFSSCASLESITLNDNITILSVKIFENCSKLDNITLPSKLQRIESPFLNCTSLSSIYIPASVTYIDGLGFSNCDSLTNITVDPENSSYKSVDNVIYSKDGGTLVLYPAGLTDKSFSAEGITTIARNAFSGNEYLESITIRSGVTEIPESCFAGCGKLANVSLPDTVTSIGTLAFSGCGSIYSIDLPDTITSIGNSAFSNTSISSITLPSNLTGTLGEYIFYNCWNLKNIVIPDKVTVISRAVFQSCTGLESITIGSGVNKIDDTALQGCKRLRVINVSTDNSYYKSINDVLFNFEQTELIKYPASKDDTEYTVPTGVTYIKPYSFEGCSNLQILKLSDTVTTIGAYAFRANSKITNIYIPSSVTSIDGTMLISSTVKPTIYYEGTQSQWENICKLTSLTVKYNQSW